MAEVVVDVAGHEVVSAITRGSAEALDLAEGWRSRSSSRRPRSCSRARSRWSVLPRVVEEAIRAWRIPPATGRASCRSPVRTAPAARGPRPPARATELSVEEGLRVAALPLEKEELEQQEERTSRTCSTGSASHRPSNRRPDGVGPRTSVGVPGRPARGRAPRRAPWPAACRSPGRRAAAVPTRRDRRPRPRAPGPARNRGRDARRRARPPTHRRRASPVTIHPATLPSQARPGRPPRAFRDRPGSGTTVAAALKATNARSPRSSPSRSADAVVISATTGPTRMRTRFPSGMIDVMGPSRWFSTESSAVGFRATATSQG